MCGFFIPSWSSPALPYKLLTVLPTDHYARKNLGYLVAVSQEEQALSTRLMMTMLRYLTGHRRSGGIDAADAELSRGARLNVYRLFKNELIWPRGFPIGSNTRP